MHNELVNYVDALQDFLSPSDEERAKQKQQRAEEEAADRELQVHF